MLKQITANMVKLPKKTKDVIQKVVHRVKREEFLRSREIHSSRKQEKLNQHTHNACKCLTKFWYES